MTKARDTSAPALLPRDVRPSKKVFLADELWKGLSDVAEFHEEAFEAFGSDEKVSRNDIIANFLEWAQGKYWAELGGKPTDQKDREAKIALMVAKLEAAKPKKPKSGE